MSARGLRRTVPAFALAIAVILGFPAGATALSPSSYISWGAPGELLNARGVAAGPKGDVVYVADHGHDRIVEYTAGGVFIRVWGGDGSADGEFEGPNAVATDELGRVYVADTGNGRVQKFSQTGEFISKWNSPGVIDIATDGNGHVFTLSGLLGIVAQRTYGGASVTAWPTQFPDKYFPYSGYENPTSDTLAITAESSGAVVAAGPSSQVLSSPEPDCHSVTNVNPSLDHHPYPDPLRTGEVVRFTAAGGVLEHGWLSFSRVDCTSGWFSYGDPTDVAVDPHGGRAYVSLEEHFIQMLPPDLGNPYAYSGTPGNELGLPCGVCDGLPQNFTTPNGLAFDCRSNLYVTTATRILKYLSTFAQSAKCKKSGQIPFKIVIAPKVSLSESATEASVEAGCAVMRCIGEVELRQVRSDHCPPRCRPLAHGTTDISGTAQSEVRLELNGRAQRLLERDSRLPVEVTFTFQGHKHAAVHQRSVLRSPSSLTLDCTVGRPDGTVLTTSGMLDPAGGGKEVELIYSPPVAIGDPFAEAGIGEAFRRFAGTGDRGRYGDSLAATRAGTWMVEADWQGDRTHQPALAQPCAVEVEPVASSVMTACPTSGIVGQPLAITGALAPPHAGTRVVIAYTSPSGRLESRVVTTAEDGTFSDDFAPSENGAWTVRARWPGDADHAGAASTECTVDVARARSRSSPD